MDKKNALDFSELEKVSGGVSSGNDNNTDRHAEFKNAWDSMGLSGIYPGNAEMEKQYKKWEEEGFQVSAFDFLMPLTK